MDGNAESVIVGPENNVDVTKNETAEGLGFDQFGGGAKTACGPGMPLLEETVDEAVQSFDTKPSDVGANSDLNSNLNDPGNAKVDKLELAVKQSDIDSSDVGAETSIQYTSAVELYQKIGAEEAVLSESVLMESEVVLSESQMVLSESQVVLSESLVLSESQTVSSESITPSAAQDGTVVVVGSAEQASVIYESGYDEAYSTPSETVDVSGLIVSDDESKKNSTQSSDTVDHRKTVEEPMEIEEHVIQREDVARLMEGVESEPMEAVKSEAMEVVEPEQVDEMKVDETNGAEGEAKSATESETRVMEETRTQVEEMVVLPEVNSEAQSVAAESVERILSVDVVNACSSGDEIHGASESRDCVDKSLDQVEEVRVCDLKRDESTEQEVVFESVESEGSHVIIENDVLEMGADNEASAYYENISEGVEPQDSFDNAEQNHAQSYESIEQQVSALVTEDDQEPVETVAVEITSELTAPQEKSISIVEAISRDFDESDSEDVDGDFTERKSNSSKASAVVPNKLGSGNVNIIDQRVIPDPSHLYIVQSVEDVIVLENEHVTQPDTIEVTVLSDEYQNVEHGSGDAPVAAKSGKRAPQIPSHVLGRNIDNPADDPFRNGKIPPKPRLGVKIPYRNLTSQIVTKDEITQEIMDRQKNKYGDLTPTTGDILFAKKLTQRLARKIAPLKPVQQEVRSVQTTTVSADKINNSDLIAILEGDGDEAESKRLVLDAAGTSEIVAKVSKKLEREIALKQLNELPKSRGRQKRSVPEMPPLIRQPQETVESQVTSAKTSGPSTSPPRTSNIEVTKAAGQQNDKRTDDSKNACANVSKAGTENKARSETKAAAVGKAVDPKSKADAGKSSAETKVKNVEAKTANVGAVVSDEVHNKNKDAKAVPTEANVTVPEAVCEIEGAITKSANSKSTNSNLKETRSQTKEIKSKKLEAKRTEKVSEATGKDDPEAAKSQIQDEPDTVKRVKPEVPRGETAKDVTTVRDKAEKPERPKEAASRLEQSSTVRDFPVERKFSPSVPIKTYTRKRKSSDDASSISSIPEKKSATAHPHPSTYITKSSRIIKRKVIWDPDEPSTARSLSSKSSRSTDSPVKVEKPTPKSAVPSRTERKPTIKKSPVKTPDKSKKRLSEVDRLLMDEGAVNMLYAVKNTNEAPKKKKSVISLDKAQRELQNKTNELKRDLTNSSDGPKSLRKKEGPIVLLPWKKSVPAAVARKKSKDSTHSSVHSRPTSPSLIYLHHAEASRIIRRHSSSSYSSLEGEGVEEEEEEEELAVEAVVVKAEPPVKAVPAAADKVAKRRSAPTILETASKTKKIRKVEKGGEPVVVDVGGKAQVQEGKNFNKLLDADAKSGDKYSKYKTFSVKRFDRLVQIILLPSVNNQVYLTPEILQELSSVLKELQEDKDCNVVLVSSSAVSFCQGINYKTLVCDKEQMRKVIAKKLAMSVSTFLKTLSTFTKILIAGVHGDTVGLGVTMLPLFDMVIASDTATFSVPNARLGCAAEGGSLLSLPHLMHNVLVSELLYAARKLIAAEALRLGMVTRVLWPDKFQQELVTVVKVISNHSLQFMQMTKKQLRHHMLLNIDSTLTQEVDTLIQHWTSVECQKNFGVYG